MYLLKSSFKLKLIYVFNYDKKNIVDYFENINCV